MLKSKNKIEEVYTCALKKKCNIFCNFIRSVIPSMIKRRQPGALYLTKIFVHALGKPSFYIFCQDNASLMNKRRMLFPTVRQSFLPTTFMLRVSFSPVLECVVADCWNRAFPTPPCHQTPVIIVIRFIPALTNG